MPSIIENNPLTTGTKTENPREIMSSRIVSGTFVKTDERNGIYIDAKSAIAEIITAKMSLGLFIKFTVKIFFFSLLHSKTCISCDITRVTSADVLAISIPAPDFKKNANAERVESPIKIPLIKIFDISPSEKKLSSLDLGFSFITSSSAGSSPNAIAGRLSVTRFTRSICVGRRTRGSPERIPKNIVITSPILQESRYLTNFLMFI